MITMKKLLTLVLTVALCLPLFMSYGVEVNAASSASEYLVYLDEYELCVKDYGNETMWTAYEMSSTLPGRSCTLPGITVDLNAKFNNSPTYTPDPPAVGLTLEFESLDMVAEGGIVEYSYSREQGLSFKFPDDAKAGDEYAFSFLINDNDGDGRKGYMYYNDGIGGEKLASLFGKLRLN